MKKHRLVQRIERRKDYSEITKHDYKLTVKKFFKFLKGTVNQITNILTRGVMSIIFENIPPFFSCVICQVNSENSNSISASKGSREKNTCND